MKYDLNSKDAYDYFLATISNKTRINICKLLLKGPKKVNQLTKAIGVDQSTISNSLTRLKSCGFVTVKPNGKERIYILNKETVKPLMNLINLHVKKYCTGCVKR